LHIREARSAISTLSSEDVETPVSSSYPLPSTELEALDASFASDSLSFKAAWYTHNGGKPTPDVPEGFKKPAFFDIALNYAELDMDALQRRAGISPAAQAKAATATTKSAQAPVQKSRSASRRRSRNLPSKSREVEACRVCLADGGAENDDDEMCYRREVDVGLYTCPHGGPQCVGKFIRHSDHCPGSTQCSQVCEDTLFLSETYIPLVELRMQ
jgi:hypothetical protein